MFFADLPMKQALFVPQSNEVLCLGTGKVFYLYDMEKDDFARVPYLNGQAEKSWEKVVMAPDGSQSAFLGGVSGNVVLYSNRSRQVAHTLNMGSAVSQAAFSCDGGPYLWTSGEEGKVYKWDVRSTRRCVAKFRCAESFGSKVFNF
jgi:WD40 repeat protein